MNTEELKRLAEAATPGPWGYDYDDQDHDTCIGILWGTNHYAIATIPYNGQVSDEKVTATGNYIAAANPAAILALIAEVDSLRDEVNGLTGEIERERKRLDFSLNREGFYDHTTRVFFCDRAFKIANPQVRIGTDDPRATIDELMGQS